MWQDRTRLALLALIVVLVLALILTIVLSLRRPPEPAGPTSPTVDVGQIETRAVQSFANGLTSTAMVAPTSVETETPEAAPTSETPTTPSVSPTPSCYRIKFLQDITVPDNTLMTPAEVFTKTWQVQNTGLCAWRPGFKLVLIGGTAMGGSPFTLESTTNPGAKIEISIKMVAPTNQTGIIQGTWRMTDETGTAFGDALTTVIVVGGTGSPIPVSTATTKP